MQEQEDRDVTSPVKLGTLQESRQQMAVRNNAPMLSPFASISNFENAQRMAKVLCNSNLVPSTYQGIEAIGDCVIALGMANRMGADPVMVMQNLYVVHGRPAWSGQFVIAAINQSGRFAEPLHFESVGKQGQDDWGFYAETTTHSGKVIKGPTVTIALAKAEGWYAKNAKWKNMPEMMLRYRAGSWFGRTECPEILMGFQTKEEIIDAIDVDPETGEVLGTYPSPAPKAPKIKTVEALREKVVEALAPEKAKPEPTKATAPVHAATGLSANQEPPALSREDHLKEFGWYWDGQRKFNVHGEMWNKDLHSEGKDKLPIINSDGHFRTRRGGPVPGATIETALSPNYEGDGSAGQAATGRVQLGTAHPGYEPEPEFLDEPQQSSGSAAFDAWGELE